MSRQAGKQDADKIATLTENILPAETQICVSTIFHAIFR